jgi:hypothetical protein
MVSKTSARLVATVLAVLALGACSDDSTSSGHPATSAAGKGTGSSATVTPAPLDTESPSVAISEAPPVKAGKAAALTEGIKVTIGPIRSIKVAANGPGEIAGDAVTVPIQVQNSSGKAFNLDGFALNATYGKKTPASPTSSGPADPLSGSLKSGSTAKGVYVFSAPHSKASNLRVEVSSSDAAKILIFRR